MQNENAAEIIRTFPDYTVFKKVTDLTAKYVGKPTADVDGYFLTPYPQRLCSLYESLKMWVLRESGDIKNFLEITKEINALEGREPSRQDKYTVKMVEWLHNSIKALSASQDTSPSIVIGLMAWGSFIDKMLNTLFPSWLTSGNIEALMNKQQVFIHIITTERDKENRILNAPILKKLALLGVHFIFEHIPEELTQGTQTENYWLIGAGVGLQLAFAKRHKAAYHHAMPDFVYSRYFFSEVLRLSKTHDNILMGCLDTDEGVLKKWLIRPEYSKDGVISISASDLAAVTLNSIHIADFFSIVNTRPDPTFIPNKHRLAWESEDTLYMAAPHLQPIYLSAKTVSALPDRFYISIDSELDLLIPAGESFYIPQECDDLFICGMTNQSSRAAHHSYTQLQRYGDAIWDAVKMRDCVKFFFRGESHKLNRALRPNVLPMKKSEILRQQEILKGVILASDPFVGKTLPKPREHDL